MSASTSSRSDTALLDGWRAGDTSAGNTLLDRHFARVYGYFTRRVGSGVDDLVQETFLACVEKRFAIRSGASFRAFLLGTARNVLLMEFRRRGQRERRDRRLEVDILPTRTSPSRFAAAREEERLLLQALRQLTPELQATLELHYWERLTCAEIADVLDIAEGTAKWRLADARKRLRSLLQEQPLPEQTLSRLDHWVHSVRRLLGDDESEPPTS